MNTMFCPIRVVAIKPAVQHSSSCCGRPRTFGLADSCTATAAVPSCRRATARAGPRPAALRVPHATTAAAWLHAVSRHHQDHHVAAGCRSAAEDMIVVTIPPLLPQSSSSGFDHYYYKPARNGTIPGKAASQHLQKTSALCDLISSATVLVDLSPEAYPGSHYDDDHNCVWQDLEVVLAQDAAEAKPCGAHRSSGSTDVVVVRSTAQSRRRGGATDYGRPLAAAAKKSGANMAGTTSSSSHSTSCSVRSDHFLLETTSCGNPVGECQRSYHPRATSAASSRPVHGGTRYGISLGPVAAFDLPHYDYVPGTTSTTCSRYARIPTTITSATSTCMDHHQHHHPTHSIVSDNTKTPVAAGSTGDHQLHESPLDDRRYYSASSDQNRADSQQPLLAVDVADDDDGRHARRTHELVSDAAAAVSTVMPMHGANTRSSVHNAEDMSTTAADQVACETESSSTTTGSRNQNGVSAEAAINAQLDATDNAAAARHEQQVAAVGVGKMDHADSHTAVQLPYWAASGAHLRQQRYPYSDQLSKSADPGANVERPLNARHLDDHDDAMRPSESTEAAAMYSPSLDGAAVETEPLLLLHAQQQQMESGIAAGAAGAAAATLAATPTMTGGKSSWPQPLLKQMSSSTVQTASSSRGAQLLSAIRSSWLLSSSGSMLKGSSRSSSRRHNSTRVAAGMRENAESHGGQNNFSSMDGGSSISSSSTAITGAAAKGGMKGNVELVVLGLSFLDLFAVGLAMPLVVPMIKSLGASPLELGMLSSAYGLVQLISGPYMGLVSDRFGRRFVILISYMGCCAGYLLLGQSKTLAVLAVSRSVTGLLKHSMNGIKAYIVDRTDRSNRAVELGRMATASGLGIMLGPILGGFLFKVGGFPLPASVASLLYILNSSILLTQLPPNELPPSVASSSSEAAVPKAARGPWYRHIFPNVSMLARPRVAALFLVRSVLGLAVQMFREGLNILVVYHFLLSAQGNGLLLSYQGALSSLVQGLAIKPLVAAFDDVTLTIACLLVMAVAAVGCAISPSVWVLTLMLAPVSLASGVLLTNFTAIMTAMVPSSEVGQLLGLSDTVMSGCRVAGPVLAGLLAEKGGHAWPGIASGLLALLAAVIFYASTLSFRSHVPSTMKEKS